MENGNSEKKTEIWLKYCEACVSSKIQHENQANYDDCCSGYKEESKL
jgi:hypothetical protein